MRHNRRTQRLGRNLAERRALVENLVAQVLTHQAIRTTLPKAKVAQRLLDRLISLGKEDSLSKRRQVFSYLQDHGLTSRVFTELAPRFKQRSGGYSRILKLGRRKGDGADLAILELTEKEHKVKEPPKKVKKAPGPEKSKPTLREEAKEAPRAKPLQKPKTGFWQKLGRFFRNKGG